jgi:predicted acylesterase/phospholipase RssA
LAEEYRFRSIGGTSAGAIAAATAAAAEFGRERGGFEKLRARSEWLAQGRHLLDLFQAAPETRPLLDAALDVMQESQTRGKFGVWRLAGILRRQGRGLGRGPALWRAAQGFGLLALLELVCVGLATLLFWLVALARGADVDWGQLLGFGLALTLALGALGAVGGYVLGRYEQVARLFADIVTRAVPEDLFGVCPGLPQPGYAAPALTQWLHESINDLAGLPPDGAPLTFAQLAEKGPAGGHERDIALQVVTTNLSHGRPYIFPLTTRADNALFLFNEEDMARLFPPSVVSALVESAGQEGRAIREALPAGYHFLPPGQQLPVIVAMRLSLSFPLLLSAVPLYTISLAALRRYSAARREARLDGFRFDPQRDLQRNWFSDGGICSNFPIHFFDAWLPRRPTFGITLTSLPKHAFEQPERESIASDYLSAPAQQEEQRAPEDPAATEPADDADAPTDAVYLPRANSPLAPDWKPIADLLSFGHAIWTAAQNYHDNTQSALPSYRERVAQIRLADYEGGLNLGMNPDTIRGMTAKGKLAGEELRGFQFDQHRWVRFLVLLNLLEQRLHELGERYDPGYDALIANVSRTPDCPYPRSGPWSAEARERMRGLLELVETWTAEDADWHASHPGWDTRYFFSNRTPKPEPTLRVTPRL